MCDGNADTDVGDTFVGVRILDVGSWRSVASKSCCASTPDRLRENIGLPSDCGEDDRLEAPWGGGVRPAVGALSMEWAGWGRCETMGCC